jgi:hypothetical protein
MTIPHWAEPVHPPYVPPPPPRKNRTALIVTLIAAILVVTLCLIGGTALLLMNNDDKPTTGTNTEATAPTQTTSFTEDDAQRECYTAFREEFEQRDAERDDQDVFATVQDIELLDTQSVDGNFVVNGTVHYSLNTGGQSVSDSLDLTCTATYGSDGSILTDVENRD